MCPSSSSRADGADADTVIRVDLGPGARGLFTTRAGGVSAPPFQALNLGGAAGDDPDHVRTNRAIASEFLGGPVAYAQQVHGTDVLEPGCTDGTGDALLGTGSGVGVLVADCVPVLLAGPGLVAAVHAGRRGLLAGVVQNALAAMEARGAGASHAVIGPAICGRCYEVPADLRADAEAVDPALGGTTSWGTPSIDLAAGVAAVLRRAGVRHIDDVGLCTYEDHRFYSYRRDGRTGRFAGLVALGGRDTPR
ncbi:polyphenol oxidase family protein [Pseudactinotalea sp. Z1748]|uniref:polyphenol oxidase family protein n=1 Tax=Pseudactinotalea sp. Z1748 TaxID=3413027 RepID=UPI003C7A963A